MGPMGAGPSGNPAFIVVGAVLLLVIAVGAISRANRRQRPVLWLALSLVLLMLGLPPWVGEKGEWLNVAEKPGQHESAYVRSPVSMGYALLWHPPPRQHFNTWQPMKINWARLAIQIGSVVLGTAVIAQALKRKRITTAPSPVGEPPD